MSYTPLHQRCAQAAKARAEAAIGAAFAAGTTTANYAMHLHMLPDPNAALKPFGVFWFNDAEQLDGGTNLRDLIGYPVHFAIVGDQLGGHYEVPTEMLGVREIVSDAMRNQRWSELVATVPEIERVEWVPDKVIDENYPAYLNLQSPSTFIFWCRKARGLSS